MLPCGSNLHRPPPPPGFNFRPFKQLHQPASASSVMFCRGGSSCRSRISVASETGKHPRPNRFGGRFGTCSAFRTAVGPNLISPPKLGSPAVSISQAISRFFFTMVLLLSPLRTKWDSGWSKKDVVGTLVKQNIGAHERAPS
ncbi:hypothetical protein AAZV13_03G049250 [Glycine max]